VLERSWSKSLLVNVENHVFLAALNFLDKNHHSGSDLDWLKVIHENFVVVHVKY